MRPPAHLVKRARRQWKFLDGASPYCEGTIHVVTFPVPLGELSRSCLPTAVSTMPTMYCHRSSTDAVVGEHVCNTILSADWGSVLSSSRNFLWFPSTWGCIDTSKFPSSIGLVHTYPASFHAIFYQLKLALCCCCFFHMEIFSGFHLIKSLKIIVFITVSPFL